MLLAKLLIEHFDSESALEHIKRLSKIHRIQATKMYEEACDYVEKALKSYGLKVERIRFPAKQDVEFLGYKSIQLWEINDAKLEIISPDESTLEKHGLDPILADYKKEPLSIVQHSASAKPPIEAELVPIKNETNPKSYPKSVKGNIALIGGNPDLVRAIAVELLGGIGIITDSTSDPSMISDPELINARVYRSFWWFGGEKKIFGFVLTPKQGLALRSLLEKKSVIVRAYVDSKFYDGYFSVVTGLIEGETEKEIWVTSHIDHPMPGAEDNSSGVGVSLEIARTLSTLISEGKIPKPRNSIRFIYMPEFLGTAAYASYRLSDIKSRKIIGAVNLDMVGSSEKHGGSLLIIEPPYELGSYVAPLMRWIMQYLISTEEKFAGAEDVPLFRWGISKFSAGSDYYILTDPLVGIDTVALNRWPYKYYHTSLDTPDKIDEKSLFRAGVLAGMFMGILSSTNSENTDWLAEITKKYYIDLMYNLMLETWTRILGNYKLKVFADPGSEGCFFSRVIGLLYIISSAGKRALERIKDNICSWWDYHRDLQEIEDMAIQYMRKIKEIFALYGEMEKREIPKIKDTRVPIRTNKLFDLEGQLSPLKYDKIERWWRIKELIPRIKYYPIIDIILFKIDGKKTVSQIIKEVYYEFNFLRPEAIEELLEFFRELGLIEFKPHKKLEKN